MHAANADERRVGSGSGQAGGSLMVTGAVEHGVYRGARRPQIKLVRGRCPWLAASLRCAQAYRLLRRKVLRCVRTQLR